MSDNENNKVPSQNSPKPKNSETHLQHEDPIDIEETVQSREWISPDKPNPKSEKPKDDTIKPLGDILIDTEEQIIKMKIKSPLLFEEIFSLSLSNEVALKLMISIIESDKSQLFS